MERTASRPSRSGIAVPPRTVALGLFVVQKACFLLVLAAHSDSLLTSLGRWDGQHFLEIADHGYSLPTEERPNSNLAMFPLLPLLGRLVATLTTLPTAYALLAIAWTGTLFAAAGIFTLVASLSGPRPAIITVLLWGAAPHAFVQLLAYTEGPFTAVVAWSLWAARRGRWALAGSLVGVGCLLRSTGVILVIVLVAYAAAGRFSESRRGTDLRKALAWACLPGVASLAAVFLHVAVRMGSLTAYFEVQRAWGTTLGSPLGTWREIAPYWSSSDPSMTPYTRDIGISLIVAAALLLALMVWAGGHSIRWPVAAFTLGVYVLTVCTLGYPQSKSRFLLPAVGLWIPPAVLLARAPVLLCGLVVAAATGLSIHLDLAIALGPWSP